MSYETLNDMKHLRSGLMAPDNFNECLDLVNNCDPALLTEFCGEASYMFSELFGGTSRIWSTDDCKAPVDKKLTKDERLIFSKQFYDHMKRYGITIHMSASPGTGLVYAWQIQEKGESQTKTVSSLCRCLMGVDVHSCRSSHETNVAIKCINCLDRGYNRPSTTKAVNENNLDTIGTLQRSYFNPHCAKAKGTDIAEEGFSPYVVSSYAIINGKKMIYDSVRDKPGKVVHLQHNIESLDYSQSIPFQVLYKSKSRELNYRPDKPSWSDVDMKLFLQNFKHVVSPELLLHCLEDEAIFSSLRNRIEILTMDQVTSIWFYLRMFRITSTGAYAILKGAYAILKGIATRKDISEEDQAFLSSLVYESKRTIALNNNNDDDDLYIRDVDGNPIKDENGNNIEVTLDSTATDFGTHGYMFLQWQPWTRQYCEASLSKLQEIAKAGGYTGEGTAKKDYEEYLKNVDKDTFLNGIDLSHDDRVLTRIIKRWFKPSLSKKDGDALTTGHENEIPLIKRLIQIVKDEDVGFDISSLRTIGLACLKEYKYFAASLDAIGILIINLENFLFALELKSVVTAATQQIQEDIACQHEKYASVNVRDAQKFAKLIPDQKHRVQLVQHMGLIRSRYGLLVYGKPGGRVIRWVL
eukprot:Awhi_evm1s5213